MGCGASVTSGSVDLLAPRGKLRAGAAAAKVCVTEKSHLGFNKLEITTLLSAIW
jgi:hypothetical protein